MSTSYDSPPRHYTWDGELNEFTIITVTSDDRPENSVAVAFQSLIAMSNGAILDEFEKAGLL